MPKNTKDKKPLNIKKEIEKELKENKDLQEIKKEYDSIVKDMDSIQDTVTKEPEKLEENLKQVLTEEIDKIENLKSIIDEKINKINTTRFWSGVSTGWD